MRKSRSTSLARRFLISSLLLLPIFVGASAWYLERSFNGSLRAAGQERLQLQVLTLLAEAEFDDALSMPAALLEQRLNTPNSGLIAIVTTPDKQLLWHSKSGNIEPPEQLLAVVPRNLTAGAHRFTENEIYFAYSWSVLWQTDGGEDAPLVFTVLEASAPHKAQKAAYRQSLLLWLGLASLLLLLSQVAVLLWSLKPLRELAEDIHRIETGESQSLQGPYPSEVRPVTSNLRRLLSSERARNERTRNTLTDLAHSLKTPLAVMRNADLTDPECPQQLEHEIARMQDIVNYQLQRATGEMPNLLQKVKVEKTIERLKQSLEKVYREKALDCQIDVAAGAEFRGDGRDLLEVLGNLMDNAFKHAQSQVRITAREGKDWKDPGVLKITIEDDGDGIPQSMRDAVKLRGTRADEQRDGQGIGLAVADSIVSSYGGTLHINDSELGGAKITIALASQSNFQAH